MQMAAEIIKISGNKIEIRLTVEFSGNMLDSEEIIQKELNEGGRLISTELIKKFDTDGSNISLGGVTFYSKGLEDYEYKTPYGSIVVARHLYQTSDGGKTYCPLEHTARIIRTATPKLAKIISHKHSKLSTREVECDLSQNHNLLLTNKYIKETSEYVGSIAQIKEEDWSYSIPELDESVHTISLGLDGTCMYLVEEESQGWREAMVGTIALYNREGARLHTTYFAASPEYGKSEFYQRMDREIKKIKGFYPIAKYIGLADGASSNWTYLENHASTLITDFWHATEYLKGAATAMFEILKDRNNWLDDSCHKLKHETGTVLNLIEEMKGFIENNKPKGEELEKIKKAITYFENQNGRMKYSDYVKNGYPIGSGVTEAACKTVIKQRFCKSGMRWKKKGSAAILSLRCLDLSGRWGQFWKKVSLFGVAA